MCDEGCEEVMHLDSRWFVCPIRAPVRKQKGVEKAKLIWTFRSAGMAGVSIFQLKRSSVIVNNCKPEGTRESAYLRQVKWFKHYCYCYYYDYYYYAYNYTLQQGKGREKEEPLCCRGKGGKSNSRRCCLCCWCNDVIAVMSHHVHTQTEGQNDKNS